MSPQKHGLRHYFFRSYQHRKVRIIFHGIHHRLEINSICRTVFKTDHSGILCYPLNSRRCKVHFGMSRHIIQEQGQRQLRQQIFIELDQFGLTCRKIIGRSRNDSIGPMISRYTGKVHALHNRGIRNTYQYRQPSFRYTTGIFNHFHPQFITETLRFTGSSQHKKSMYATCNEMFNQFLQTFHIQYIIIQ